MLIEYDPLFECLSNERPVFHTLKFAWGVDEDFYGSMQAVY